MRERKNIRCFKCGKPVPIESMHARVGKCIHCEYQMTGQKLTKFF